MIAIVSVVFVSNGDAYVCLIFSLSLKLLTIVLPCRLLCPHLLGACGCSVHFQTDLIETLFFPLLVALDDLHGVPTQVFVTLRQVHQIALVRPFFKLLSLLFLFLVERVRLVQLASQYFLLRWHTLVARVFCCEGVARGELGID